MMSHDIFSNLNTNSQFLFSYTGAPNKAIYRFKIYSHHPYESPYFFGSCKLDVVEIKGNESEEAMKPVRAIKERYSV